MIETPRIQESFLVHPLAPFRLDLTVWTLRRKAANRIDRWDGTHYTRILVIDGAPFKVRVSQQQTGQRPEALITVSSTRECDRLSSRIGAILQRMLGFQADLRGFYGMAAEDTALAPLAQQFLGVKPPRFPSIFEALLNAFACQQVSLDVGILLLNRLAGVYGMKFDDDQTAFPEPKALADASLESLRALGFSHQKARAIIELATTLVSGQQDVSLLDSMTNEEIKAALLPIRGVGRWSAEYVLLRGLGRVDTFPGDDVGAQKNLQRLLHLAEKPTYQTIKGITLPWQPYAGLVYFHLLLEKLYQKGLLL